MNKPLTADSQSDQSIGKQSYWYHYGWLWFVIALPITVVIAAIITVAIAFHHAPRLLPIESEISTTNPQNELVIPESKQI